MNVNSLILTHTQEGPSYDPTAVMEIEWKRADGHYVYYRSGILESISLFGVTYYSHHFPFSLYEVLCAFMGITESTLDRMISNERDACACPHGHPNDFI